MRRFIIELIINALIMALVVPFLPGILINNPTIWLYLVIGLVVSLLSRLLKPLLFILTGRLVIWNVGLWVMVLNVITFILAGWLLSPRLQAGNWFWVIVSALIVSLVLTVADALFGFDRPPLDPNRQQPIWRLIDRLPGTSSSKLIESLRLQQIYDTFWSYGLEIALVRSPVRQIRETVSRWITGQASELDAMTTPQKVRLMLQQLGPMYVKLGQMVSSQGEGLPPEWHEELDKLQSTVAPFPYEAARQLIIKELGAPPEQLFASFEQTPLAAASTAQVHRATLHTGEQVVVKVQRPNIVSQVQSDLRIMEDFSRKLEQRFQWARDMDIVGMVSEFAAGVNKELDYHNEAYQMLRLADNMTAVPGVHVPTLYQKFSTSKVLTMEFVSGVKITKIKEIEEAGLNRTELAQNFNRAITKQIFIDGFFHGDPHPGNLFVDPQSGLITFLDLGLVGQLRQDQRLDLVDLIFSLQQMDAYSIAQTVRRLSKQTRPLDEQAYLAAVERVLLQNWKYSSEVSFAVLMNKVLNEMSRFGLRMNKELTLAVKALSQSQEATYTLAPELDPIVTTVEQLKELVVERYNADYIVSTVKTQAIRSAKEVVRRLPSLQEATVKWIDQYQRGKFVVEIDTGDLTQQMGRISQGFQQLMIGLILVGMLIGSAIGAAFLYPLVDNSQWVYVYGLILVVFLGVLVFSGVIVYKMFRLIGQPQK